MVAFASTQTGRSDANVNRDTYSTRRKEDALVRELPIGRKVPFISWTMDTKMTDVRFPPNL